MARFKVRQYIEVCRFVEVEVPDGGTIEDALDILNEMPLDSNRIDPAQGRVIHDWDYVEDSDDFEYAHGEPI